MLIITLFRVPLIHAMKLVSVANTILYYCISIGSAWITNTDLNGHLCKLCMVKSCACKKTIGVWLYLLVCATDTCSSRVMCSSCAKTVSTFLRHYWFTHLKNRYQKYCLTVISVDPINLKVHIIMCGCINGTDSTVFLYRMKTHELHN